MADGTNNEKYLILSTRVTGTSVMWWRPNEQGYTEDVSRAGHYDERQAFRILGNNNKLKAFKVSTIFQAIATGKLPHMLSVSPMDIQKMESEI